MENTENSKKPMTGKIVTACVLFAASVVVFVVSLLVRLRLLAALSVAAFCVAAGLAIYICGKALAARQPSRSVLPILALALDLACIPSLLIALFLLAEPFSVFSLLFFLAVPILPVAGIGVGVISLSRGVAKVGVWGFVLSIIAIALPVIFVAVAIPLYSSGVIVISLM